LAVYESSSITTSPDLISLREGFLASWVIASLPITILIRASTSAGPAVSRITSVIPQSALMADSPPSVVTIINGVETPVVVINFVKDFAVGRSRLASMIMQSVIGASTKTDASAGRIRTSCCSKPELVAHQQMHQLS
jgi:hypothetical protein